MRQPSPCPPFVDAVRRFEVAVFDECDRQRRVKTFHRGTDALAFVADHHNGIRTARRVRVFERERHERFTGHFDERFGDSAFGTAEPGSQSCRQNDGLRHGNRRYVGGHRQASYYEGLGPDFV